VVPAYPGCPGKQAVKLVSVIFVAHMTKRGGLGAAYVTQSK